ncbi:MAG TPA: CinA family protein [Marmoricola sp.]|nr:CinA family protein [Marmoricola sp.]
MSDTSDVVEAIASLAGEHDFGVATAESLTCGQLAADLGAGPDASTWFRGGVVAYASRVKFDVLGVTPGPVVTDRCAREMAAGAAELLQADAVVSTTGVGGPDVEEGEPPGTVHVAVQVRGNTTSVRLELSGDPAEVLAQTRVRALDLLHDAMRADVQTVSAPPRPDTARDGGPADSPSRAASR